MDTGADEQTLDAVDEFRRANHLGAVDHSLVGRLNQHVSDRAASPAEYISGCFGHHDLVFLGEFGPSLQGARFLTELIPHLMDAGVWNLGVDWLLADDQPLIDLLIGAPDFDPDLALNLVYRWGIRHLSINREHVEILRAAWAVNRRRDPGAPNFRVVGLDYDLAYDTVTDTADLLQPEAWTHLRDRGPLSRFMAMVINTEFVSRRARALIAVNTSHALTQYRRPVHPEADRIDTEIDNGRVLGAGNHVFGTMADRVKTVLLHQPLTGTPGMGPELVFPADGLIDLVFAAEDGPKFPVGFDVTGGPFAPLPSSTAHESPALGAWTGGYVFLGPMGAMNAATPAPEAIGEDNLAEARRRTLAGSMRAQTTTLGALHGAMAVQASVTELIWQTVGR
ncbi:MAG TPA: hypothetical protein ENI86_06050 [Acidimicrobiales bacterium]|nr:hypothetical protein [Acidimicrobiales bacterium]